MRLVVAVACLIASGAAAQEGMRDSDELLTRAELTEVLAGNVLEFYTDGLATYRADGGYDWRYSPEGRRVPGTYEVMEDSTVCIAFDNGFSRCDYLVRNGARLVMIIESGARYPVRAIAPIE